jgi:hypothetical protein
MRKRVFVGTGVLLLAAVVFVLFSLFKPPVPVAFIQVLDEQGRPISNATIAPDGLRPKKGGGHYGWSARYERSGVKADTVRTDADGYAEVRYPYYVIERLETEQISFAVDHPDFCPDRPFRKVAPSPPANAPLNEKLRYLVMRLARQVSARPDPVALKRGGTVRLTGYVGAKENIVTNLNAEISDMWPAGTNFWQRTGPVLWSKKATPGTAHLRAVHFPPHGPVMFSKLVSFEAKAGETNEFALELKPGVRVTGRLDESVPRPVRGGRVCTRVFEEGHDGDSDAPVWCGWRTVNAEGEFVFESLPPGRMEVIGMGDGFLSANGQPLKGRTTSQRLPQWFSINGREQVITLQMEAAASCEVTVLDDAGKPLAGAKALFWPNVLWGGNGSTVFATDTFNSEDVFRNGRSVDWLETHRLAQDDFRAISASNGVALVRTLPAGNQSYRVSHTNYAMPISRAGGGPRRSADVNLSPGETGRVTVKMQKAGTEALTH